MANIGFVGLGIMGQPMAGHLIKGGHQVYLHSIPSVPQALVDAGGVACANGKEVAQKADIVITMVPDTPHVEAVLFGDHGIAQGLAKGKTAQDPIGAFMTRRVQTVSAETLASEALTSMLEGRFSSLPVVSDEAGLVGIVTSRDFLMVAQHVLAGKDLRKLGE